MHQMPSMLKDMDSLKKCLNSSSVIEFMTCAMAAGSGGNVAASTLTHEFGCQVCESSSWWGYKKKKLDLPG